MPDPSQLNARRAAAATAWTSHPGPVLIPAGLPVPIAGTDQFHSFHAHAEQYYLSGSPIAGSALTFDSREGWTLFMPLASIEERVWSGDGESPESAATASGIEAVRPIDGLTSWLERRRGEPLALLGNRDILGNPAGYGIANWQALEVEIDETASGVLSDEVSNLRRAKAPDELGLMRMAAGASAAGHLLAMRKARAGLTERQLQVEVEAEFFRHGAQRTAYSSLVGGGPNASVLHFSPTSRPFGDGDLVLMDAAGEVDGYAADITRTFPIAARFSGVQRDLYQLVLAVQETAVRGVRPGVEFLALHLAAAEQIAAGLVDLGILRGDPAALVEQDAHAIFFPHGLGHMLGLATHDAGGCLAGRTKSDRFGLKWLRADLPLQENYVVTIEPGVYFIKALLTNPEWRTRHRDTVRWERVDSLLDFGGIRIEDDVRVTPQGSEVLSASIPKSIEAIEAIRREALER